MSREPRPIEPCRSCRGTGINLCFIPVLRDDDMPEPCLRAAGHVGECSPVADSSASSLGATR